MVLLVEFLIFTLCLGAAHDHPESSLSSQILVIPSLFAGISYNSYTIVPPSVNGTRELITDEFENVPLLPHDPLKNDIGIIALSNITLLFLIS